MAKPKPRRAVNKTAVKPVAKKTIANGKVSAKPKAKTGTNLKKGGLAPGSKQVEIAQAQRKAQSATYPGPGKGSMIQGIKDIAGKGNSSKAIKELDKLRKSVGWKDSKYGTGAETKMYGNNKVDREVLRIKSKTKKK